MTSQLPSEKVAVVGKVDPDANGTGTFGTDWANAENFHSFMAIVSAGIIVASGTVDCVIQQATSSTGAGAVTVAGKAITQLTTANNDSQAIINLRTDELNVGGGFSFVRALMTLTTAGSDSDVIMLALEPRYGPANQNDLASVAEIVA